VQKRPLHTSVNPEEEAAFFNFLFFAVPAVCTKLTRCNIDGFFEVVQTVIFQRGKIQFFADFF
jgi:hypothetical protein